MVYTREAMNAARTALLSILVATSALLAAPGCEPPAPHTALSYTEDAKRAYAEAMEEFEAENWIEAQTLMREVKRKYSYSKYARLAELRIADADFEQEKFAEAIRGYRQFVHDHRSDPKEISYARARIAESQYRQISESFLLPTADERDQAVILDAFKELKGYIHDYPDSEQSKKIRALLQDVTARLMRHELYVARFYLRRDNFKAAVMRVQYAMRNFAGGPQLADLGGSESSGLEAEALLLLGEVYLKMHKYKEARDSFAAILHDYPQSPLVRQATNYLAYMRGRGV